MTIEEIKQLIDTKGFVACVSVIGGALLGVLITNFRSRTRILDYTVHHERLAFTAEDETFGKITVMWQGEEATRLFLTTVELRNQTGQDFKDIVVKVYTGEYTALLGGQSQIIGTPFHIPHTQSYEKLVHVEQGQEPTTEQFTLVRGQREYLIAVLNRGGVARLQYLTHVRIAGNVEPEVFLGLQQEGATVRLQPWVHRVLGVPYKTALCVGTVIAWIILILSGRYISNVWIACSLCLLAGYFVQSTGAFIWRSLKFLKSLLLP